MVEQIFENVMKGKITADKAVELLLLLFHKPKKK
jgi:hypothetical protein